MAQNATTSATFVAIVKNHSLNKQAQFFITPKKTLKSGKNTFIA
jgi:hypothetical protein